MLRKQSKAPVGYTSRRQVLQSLMGFMIALWLEGCSQTYSTSATPVPIATSRPRGSVLVSYQGHTGRVTSVAWSPDSKYIASGSLDETVQVWSANPADHFHPVIYHGHNAGVLAVAWSPDSTRVASGSIDKTVQVWDAISGEQITLLQGHTDFVNTVAWSPDARYIGSGSADSTVRVWDASSGKLVNIYRGHYASVNAIVWSPDSRWIASGASDNTVQILEVSTGNQRYTYRGHTNTVSSVSWSPGGKFIASGSWDKTVQVWNPSTGAHLYTYDGYNVKAAQANPAAGVLPDLIFAVAWSHNGKRLAAITQVYCGDVCGIMLSWDALTERNFAFYVDQPIFSMAWSPDDTRIVNSISITSQRFSKNRYVVQISQA